MNIYITNNEYMTITFKTKNKNFNKTPLVYYMLLYIRMCRLTK